MADRRPARRHPLLERAEVVDGRDRGDAARARAQTGSGEAPAAVAAAGQHAVIKPIPLRAAVPGGFTADDFTINIDSTVTCPNGTTRPISTHGRVTFGVRCHGCPLAASCTTSQAGRTLRLHEHARSRACRTGR